MTREEAHEDLTQAVFGWIKAALSLEDRRVLPSDDNTVEREKPYLVVRLSDDDTVIGKSERYNVKVSNVWRPVVRKMVRGTVSIQGFGPKTRGWLAGLEDSLNIPATLQYLDDNALTIMPITPVQNLTADGNQASMEARFSRDFDLTFIHIYRDDNNEVVPAQVFTLASEFNKGEDDADPLPVDITESLTP